jgi:hypothetical protein
LRENARGAYEGKHSRTLRVTHALVSDTEWRAGIVCRQDHLQGRGRFLEESRQRAAEDPSGELHYGEFACTAQPQGLRQTRFNDRACKGG